MIPPARTVVDVGVEVVQLVLPARDDRTLRIAQPGRRRGHVVDGTLRRRGGAGGHGSRGGQGEAEGPGSGALQQGAAGDLERHDAHFLVIGGRDDAPAGCPAVRWGGVRRPPEPSDLPARRRTRRRARRGTPTLRTWHGRPRAGAEGHQVREHGGTPVGEDLQEGAVQHDREHRRALLEQRGAARAGEVGMHGPSGLTRARHGEGAGGGVVHDVDRGIRFPVEPDPQEPGVRGVATDLDHRMGVDAGGRNRRRVRVIGEDGRLHEPQRVGDATQAQRAGQRHRTAPRSRRDGVGVAPVVHPREHHRRAARGVVERHPGVEVPAVIDREEHVLVGAEHAVHEVADDVVHRRAGRVGGVAHGVRAQQEHPGDGIRSLDRETHEVGALPHHAVGPRGPYDPVSRHASRSSEA